VGHVLVLGAGNGGLAVAADLSLRGQKVKLWNRSQEPLAALRASGGIACHGVLGEVFAPLAEVGTDLAQLIEGAEAVIVALPATAHQAVATSLAEVLPQGLPVLLNPGGVLGSLAFARRLRAAGYRGELFLGETGTLTHICRKEGDAGVRITSRLTRLPTAALPGRRVETLLAVFQPLLPGLEAAPHTLATGLANVNAVFHPPGMVLAAAWIEATGGAFHYYADLAVPSVARLMAAIDAERLAVARAYGLALPTFVSYLAAIGSTSAEAAERGDYLLALRDSEPNRTLAAPPSLEHRYILEDIPLGVVPITELGRAAGVPTPVMDAVVTVLSTATGRSLARSDRTLVALGLADKSVAEILHLVEEGEL
jgi:opine dehydrogenase